MPRALVQLTWRQVIDCHSPGDFERRVFNQTFQEFTFKCQEYNPGSQFVTFTEMMAHYPKAASLHYKTALAIGNTMKSLHQRIPHLATACGQQVAFDKYELQLLESSPVNPMEHRIAIDYTTGQLYFLENLHEWLLLADATADQQPYASFMIRLQQGLDISRYQPL